MGGSPPPALSPSRQGARLSRVPLPMEGVFLSLLAMHIDYSISLWNYTHYASAPSLERILDLVRSQGYGIELWGAWRDEPDLFDPVGIRRLKPALEGMRVSLHTAGAPTLELHRKQIDAARQLGAEVVVLHSDDLYLPGSKNLDVDLANQAVAYAQQAGVRLALENGQLPFIKNTFQQVDGLYFCLDVGHVYLTTETMASFLAAFKSRLIHIHLQDILSEPERGLPKTMKDHYIPGTGGIPMPDWQLFSETLREIDFTGTAVFEIQPRQPLQTALLGKSFVQGLIANR
jgi:sugar phosphate isomerase/epimerase